MRRSPYLRHALGGAVAVVTALVMAVGATPGRAADRATAGTAAAHPAGCALGPKLVPTCNILWGAAAGGFSETPRDRALREWEQASGRPASIYHTYHRGDELFPTRAEIAMARDAAHPRLLLINWKVAYGTRWADVAAGRQDARIDRLAAHLKANYRDRFFLALHHEPENDVIATTGSGMTAGDYAAMFRHTILRLRAQGVTNAVSVVAYMGIEKFYNQSWWYDLYPGDDVVDWIGLDAYVASKPGGYHFGTLSNLLNRTTDRAAFPGFYTWSQTRHADKPLMLSEWGVHEYAADPSQKARILSTVLTELDRFPAVRAMVWFDTAKDQNGADIRIDSSPAALAAFRQIAASPRFTVSLTAAATADTTAPTVTIVAPTTTARARGTVVVTAAAADAGGIARVQLLVGGTVVATDTAAPWALRWRSTASGRRMLTVRAVDRAGNVALASRRVVVDNIAPALAVRSAPGNRARVRGTVTVRLGARDVSGIRRVEALINGRVVARDHRAPYVLRLDTSRRPRTMTVTLRTYDGAGNARYAPTRIWHRR